jgi:CheY-like chemotaxis protein
LAGELEAIERSARGLFDAPEPASVASMGSKTVLLVDPDTMGRKVIRGLLEGLGHTVLEADIGRRALEICREHAGAIDLILASIFLPDIGGRELAGSAAAIRPDLAVLFIAPADANDVLYYGMLAGQPTIVGRPLTADALARCLSGVFEVEYAR